MNLQAFVKVHFFSQLSIINEQSAHVLLFSGRNLFYLKNLYIHGVPIVYSYSLVFPKSF